MLVKAARGGLSSMQNGRILVTRTGKALKGDSSDTPNWTLRNQSSSHEIICTLWNLPRPAEKWRIDSGIGMTVQLHSRAMQRSDFSWIEFIGFLGVIKEVG